MDNHFHLIIKSESAIDYSEEDITKRVNILSKGKIVPHLKRLDLIDKLSNISEYMKSIKETFSRWYNKRNNRTGYFWGDRFKSIILEKKAAVSHCLAYIDLNPVRANIVDIPEDYKWNSVYARVNNTKIASNLYFTGLFDEFLITFKKALLLYRKFLYAVGAVKKTLKGSIPLNKAFQNKDLEFKRPHYDHSTKKIRHFSDGCILGSKEFIGKMYSRFAGKGIYKKDRKVYKTPLPDDIVSLQRLKNIPA